MSYFVLMGRRIPKQAITGFRFQNETDNIRPFLSIRIRGKEEIIPFKDKREIMKTSWQVQNGASAARGMMQAKHHNTVEC